MIRTAIAAVCVFAFAAEAQVSGGLGGGGPLGVHEGPCVSDAERAFVEAALAERGSAPGPYAPRGGVIYPFYPMAGRWYQDTFTNNYVDLEPGAGIQDYECTGYTYNGHDAHDIDIRSFGEQARGVPIYAALPGTVAMSHDGEFDMNTTASGQPANYVIIDHGGGHRSYYWHMKNGSVAVSAGETVVAGQQIGLVGSSGSSTQPHLHFATYVNSVMVEPSMGACRAGASNWLNQLDIDRSFRIADFAFSADNLAAVPGLPFEMPRTGQLGLSNQPHWFWLKIYGLPAASNWRVRYIRPNGTTAFTSSLGTFGGGQPFYRWSWWWFRWDITEMRSTTGTWRMQLEINGAVVVDAEVEVASVMDPSYNRAPLALGGLSFDPSEPEVGDVIRCSVDTDLVHDDPDFDIVSYEYTWKINGATVRTTTHAGQSDCLRADLAAAGDTVRCEVRPWDGTLYGPMTAIEVDLPGGGCPADWDQSGGIDGDDITAFFVDWQAGNGDIDQSGGTDGDDITVFFDHWQAGC